ncbi:MAG: lipoprotein insertase outer membrane protein LolB [Marinobacter sp.]|uniref:lipoprotein insertase outer membrane protein LolB n=1 Tax=Marinobacter sp. TaxID=50741 RepID=UPI00299E0ABC|nr:lipoprotein insertase outer membrane protein LolB [Marinobacter sp.]MDX1633503.1 lipoprotein insertase outer membrane protein LolB [Marinobacter sp.]
MRSTTLVALLAATLLAAGCATPPPPVVDGLTSQPPADWSQRQQALSEFRHWQLQGKLAVRQAEDSGSAVINRWTQHREQYQLSLSSAFLGLGHTELSGQPGYLELTLPDGETYRSTDPDALMEAATGWQLPLASLSWWIRGLPAPAGNFELLFDDTGTLAVIRQDGWEIRYDRWQDFLTDRPRLPARITATKADKRVRVVVTDWQSLMGQR